MEELSTQDSVPAEPGKTVLETSGITIGQNKFLDIAIPPGFTLLQTEREASSSSYSMVLSGRMRPDEGEISIAGVNQKISALARQIALTGVDEIDHLDRLVTVSTVVREQIAWAQPWYRRTPRDIGEYQPYRELSETLNLQLKPKTLIGELHVNERFRLRILLAMIARPNAHALIVDNPDQVRTITERTKILGFLKKLSEDVPVVIVSTNPDLNNITDSAFEVVRSGEK